MIVRAVVYSNDKYDISGFTYLMVVNTSTFFEVL